MAPAIPAFSPSSRRWKARCEDPLDAAALAHIGGLSVRQMERRFAQALKQRPMGFYLDLRLEKAERLLTYSHMSVRDVSVTCGFSSLAQFSRAFKARRGRPPSALRRVPSAHDGIRQ